MSTATTEFLWDLIPLACFLFFTFFSFCDGFKLHPARKLMFAGYFLALAIFVYTQVGFLSLRILIPFASLLAMTLGWFQIKDNERDA